MAMPTTVGVKNAKPMRRFQGAELRAIEKAIRRIVRAHDLQSKALVKASGLTAGQLVVMKGIAELGEVTSTALSAYADISSATIVMVLDNLEERGLIQRYRSESDRRIVHTRLTERGTAALALAPEPMGEEFAGRFAALGEDGQRSLAAAVVRLADLMTMR
jgi:DNA-binding MarR family transcriptional regulator